MVGNIIYEMIKLNGRDVRRINHALKVYGFAKCIAERESVDNKTLLIIETAAVLHDIAIRFCEKTFGSSAGHLQEREGPGIAKPILETYTNDDAFIERVLFLIAHHHTYDNIDGVDYQIIIEADFLVNNEEGNITWAAFSNAYEKYFKTTTGKELARIMMGAGL
jgi:hypothetical protein